MVRSKLESDMGNYLNIKIDEDEVFFNFFPDNIKSATDWKLNLSDHAVVIVDLGNTLKNMR